MIAKLKKAGLGEHAPAIAALARASIRIQARRCKQDALPLGASRFGGVPDLPPGFAWPRYRDRPLAFLAQIDLAALPDVEPAELPRAGTLAFFYEIEDQKWGFDPADRGCARVAFFETPPAALRPTPPPETRPSDLEMAPCRLSFKLARDLPGSFDLLFEPHRASLDDRQTDAYDELPSVSGPERYHHLLGHPQLIQFDMRMECQLVTHGIYCGTQPDDPREAALRPGATDWQLLLQIDSDESGPGWMWGDLGRLYFWIRRQDLAFRRFDAAWLILQCS